MLMTQNNHGTGVSEYGKNAIQNSDWKGLVNLSREVNNSEDEASQANIQWEPDYEKYLARSTRRNQSRFLPTTVPRGWPTQFNSSLAWKGSQLISKSGNDDLFVHHLSAEEVSEVRAAVKGFKSKFSCHYLELSLISVRIVF